MILAVAAAVAAEPAWPAYDVIGVTGIAAAPVGIGLVVGGYFAQDTTLAGAGIVTALAAPPLLATSVLLNRAQLKDKPSAAPVIVCLGAWAGATTIYTIGATSETGGSTTASLAMVGLYALSMGAGTVAQVEVWDRRPVPARVSIAPGPTGVVISGTF